METRQFQEQFSVEGHFPLNHEFAGRVIRLSWWRVTAGGGDGDDSSQVAEAWHFPHGDRRTDTVTEWHQICGTCVAFYTTMRILILQLRFTLKQCPQLRQLLVRYEVDQK